MRFSVLSTVAALASTGAALPPGVKILQAFPAAGGTGYTWSVENFEAGNVRSGGYYNFNVTGVTKDTGNKIPAFKAYCSGYSQPQPYTFCEIIDETGVAGREVAAKLLPANTTTDPGAHLALSYEFSDVDTAGMWWNYTGYATADYNAFVAPPQNFSVAPSEILAAA